MKEVILDRPYKSKALKEYNILYVDDEVVNLRIFKQSFKRDFEVFVAPDGFQAIEILEKNKIDLIITDQQMPGMTGSQLLIKVVPHYPNIVRMIMTGFSDLNAIADVVNKVGLDKYLVKPWNKDELKNEFDDCLKARVKSANGKSNQMSIDDSSVDLIKPEILEGLQDELNIPYTKEKITEKTYDYDKIINCSVNLKESLLPKQQELRMMINDAFILHERFKPSKNGYWFGENRGKILVTSFSCNTEDIQALTLSTFIATSLIELFYKEQLSDPADIISNLSQRIQYQFFSLIGTDQGLSTDIALIVYDKKTGKLSYSGANRNVQYMDNVGAFREIEGSALPIGPGMQGHFSSTEVNISSVHSVYFIPNDQIKEKKNQKKKTNETLTINNILEDIHDKYPMSMQHEILREYKYKNLIGMKF